MTATLRALPSVVFLLALALAPPIAGCGRQAGPPRIVRGTSCATCGMAIEDLRFACERQAGGRWRVYDAIECLVRDPRGSEARDYLADYDASTLHPAESLWVVKGSFPTPMGGGYAAFLDRAAADAVAAKTAGRVDRLAGFAAGGARP